MAPEKFGQRLEGERAPVAEVERAGGVPVLEQIDTPISARERAVDAQREVENATEQGHVQLDNIEQSAGLSQEDTSAVRVETGILEKLAKIQERMRELVSSVSEKLGNFYRGDTSTTQQTEESMTPRMLKYRGLLEAELNKERTVEAPLIREALNKRNELLEGRGLFSLSKEDFDTHFASENFEIHADLKQGNVGDCYAVAAIHALSTSPHYEMIVRSATERLPDGSWRVRVPFLSTTYETITLTPEDLLPQKNEQFLKKPNDGLIDIRPRLHPPKGKEGLRALEAAYIKHKFGKVDRIASEGGWGHEVLTALGGDNFYTWNLMAGYDAEEHRYDQRKSLDSLTSKDNIFLEQMLEQFDPNIHIMNASTRHLKPNTLEGVVTGAVGMYKGKGTGKLFVPGHAYSVARVNPKEKTMVLVNPWDTTKPIELTFDQFKGSFSAVSSVRINMQKMLGNMEATIATREAA